MKEPLLSVCVITYNHEPYIRQAIESILEQKVDFVWQLVIADDCSTDGTRNILQEYKKKYPELIHLILQEKNVGPEANWLDLIAYPKTPYLLYAEGDDYFTDSQKLQKQVDFLEAHKHFSLCFHPVKVVYQDKSRPDEIFPTPEQRFDKDVLELADLLKGNFIQTNSAMYRWRFTKESIKNSFPRGIAPGDWFLHLLHADAGKIGFMNEVMAVYRRHAAGLWWVKDQDMNLFWKRNGTAHLALYAELLRIYGGKEAYKATIYTSVSRIFVALSEVPADAAGNDILSKAMGLYPAMAAEVFRRYHAESLANIQDHRALLNSQAEHIKKLEAIIDRQASGNLKELASIKNSKTYKLAERMARVKRMLEGKHDT